MDKRPPAEWRDLVAGEHTPITIEEYRAGIEARQLNLLMGVHQALQHIEGMIGALDQYMLASQGAAYPSSQEVREALAFYREHRYRQSQMVLEQATGEQNDG